METTKLVYHVLAGVSLLILISACSGKLASWINMPYLLLFLGVGMLAGSEGVGGVVFDNPQAANFIGSVAMAFILLSGGFDTEWQSVRKVLSRGTLLSSLGVLLTALFVGVFAWGFLRLFDHEISLTWCFLLGAMVSSTDAAAVFTVLRGRSVSLRGDLRPLLEFESGSNDPMAAFLTIFLLDIVMKEGRGVAASMSDYLQILPQFAIRMAVGVAVGWAIGWVAGRIVNRINLEFDGLYYVLAVGVGLFAFSGAELAHGNGFMSVYVTGLVMGNHRFTLHNSIGRFYDGFAWLMQVVLFTMLGLLVFPSHVWQAKWAGLGVALFLIFAARPLAVCLCLWRSGYTLKERLFVAWVGLRGGAPIMLATFPLMAGAPEAGLLFNIVFFIVILSIVLQGATIMPLARWLGVDAPLSASPRAPLMFEHTGNMDGQTRNFTLPGDSPLAGCPLSRAGLPHGALVLLIRREGRFIPPNGSTVLRGGDELMIIGPDAILAATAAVLSGAGPAWDAVPAPEVKLPPPETIAPSPIPAAVQGAKEENAAAPAGMGGGAASGAN
ncbi:MAG: potassium/proton antiporter [Planctomycetes bacterium]|nr:potassium/proton antiporter [Planctomycetota bacterium]